MKNKLIKLQHVVIFKVNA